MFENASKVLAQKQIARLCNLGILVSRRCNISCSNCITVSSPRVKDYPPSYNVQALIKQAATHRDLHGTPKTISFTGGEPLLNKADLYTWSKLAAKSGFKVGIVTNAFWARTTKSTAEIISQFSHINAFDISTDLRHNQFIHITNIENAIKGLTEAGKLGAVRFVRQDGDDYFYDEIQKILDKHIDNRLVTSTLITLNQDGEPTLNKERQSKIMPNIPCMSMSPLITPSSWVVACCGPLVNSKVKHPLVLGNLATDGLTAIYQNLACNPIAHALRIGGIETLLEIIEFTNCKIDIPDFYDPQDPCFSCFHIVTKISSSDYQELLHHPRIQARIAMLRYVLLGEEEGIDLLDDEAFNQMSKEYLQMQKEFPSREVVQ